MALDIFKLQGVQQMLGNLLRAAAPELADQVNEIANTAIALKEQFDRIEHRQIAIMAHLGIADLGEDHGGKDLGGLDRGNPVASNGTGKQAGK